MNYQGNENKYFELASEAFIFDQKKLANFCSFAWKQQKNIQGLV